MSRSGVRPGWRRAFTWVLLVVSVVAVVWLAVRDEEAREAIGDLGPTPIIALVAVHGCVLLIQSYRYWIVLIRCGGEAVGIVAWTRLYVVGRLLNVLFPQGGNVYRGVVLKRDYSLSYTQYAGSFFGFTWLSTALNLAFAVIILAFLTPGLTIAGVNGVAGAAMLLAAVLAGPFAFRAALGREKGGTGWRAWAAARAREVLAASIPLMRDATFSLRFIISGVVALVAIVGLFAIAFGALGVEAGLSTMVLMYVLLQLSTYINITPGNFGVLELAFGAITAAVGIGLADGLVAAALMRFTGYAALAIAGISIGGLRAFRDLHAIGAER